MGKRANRLRGQLKIRRAQKSDLDDVVALERAVFTADVMSRQSLRRCLGEANAVLLVAEFEGAFAGFALVFFRVGSPAARLYSIAVAPASARQGVGSALLAAAEAAAIRKRCRLMRLEAQADNRRAIARYRKSGYRLFARRCAYYDDGSDALRFDKPLARNRAKRRPGVRGKIL